MSVVHIGLHLVNLPKDKTMRFWMQAARITKMVQAYDLIWIHMRHEAKIKESEKGMRFI